MVEVKNLFAKVCSEVLIIIFPFFVLIACLSTPKFSKILAHDAYSISRHFERFPALYCI